MFRLVQTVPVWGVNSKDEIFRWTGSSFTPVPNGALKQISVGNGSGSVDRRATGKSQQ